VCLAGFIACSIDRRSALRRALCSNVTGGVIGGSGVTYDSNGRANGQIANMPIQSWTGNGYQIDPGQAQQLSFDVIDLASTFAVWPWGGSNTAKLQSEFPLLASCTDKTLKPPVSCPGPGDLLWNAKQDLAQQHTHDPNCVQAARNNVFNIFNNNGGDSNGKPIYANHFVGYLQDNPHFYNGPIAKVFYAYLCGQPQRANCGGSTLTVAEAWDSGTTALTDTPSYPFQSFWQPTYTPPSPNDPTAYGFGVGIDPGNYGANIYTESDLFHEALHGITGKIDHDIASLLHATAGSGESASISIYIMQNVLSKCSSFVKK
jgi:hypothetical protein